MCAWCPKTNAHGAADLSFCFASPEPCSSSPLPPRPREQALQPDGLEVILRCKNLIFIMPNPIEVHMFKMLWKTAVRMQKSDLGLCSIYCNMPDPHLMHPPPIPVPVSLQGDLAGQPRAGG